MRLESFRVKGLGTFRAEWGFDLSTLGDARLIAIVGPNGSGKSTSLELALPGAMYRQTPTRGSLRDLAVARDAFLESRIVNGQAWTIRHTVDAVSGKGESVVLDADGRVVLESSKLKDFDAWAARTLPSPEVLFSTVFAAQGAGGFLAMRPGDRKAVLLRVLGVERWEAMAESARQHGRDARQALAVLEARIADERARVGDPAELVGEAERAKTAAGQADYAVTVAIAELARRRELAQECAAAAETYRAAVAARRALDEQAAKARASVTDFEQKLANNRSVLKDAARIREAVETDTKAKTELDRVDREAASVREAIGRLCDAAVGHDRIAADAERAQRDAEERARRGRERLRMRPAVEAAASQIATLTAEAERADAKVEAARQSLETLQSKRVAGAEQRIGDLRGALATIRGSKRADAARIEASRALAADDAVVDEAAKLPGLIVDTKTLVANAEAEAKRAREALAAAEQLAGRAPDLDATAADVEAAEREATEHADRVAAACRDAAQAREASSEQRREHERLTERAKELGAELARLAPTVRLAAPLANAEARIAELEPLCDAARAELARLEKQISATPEPGQPPTAPDLAPFERDVEVATAHARRLHAEAAVAAQRVEAMQAARERQDALEAERSELDAELADWQRLAEDLGRDGIQALEIDAAGPELSALVNDLLHTAFGPRWTVTIETQRLSADGKRQIEGCEVRVLDTVEGRDGEASTFSGGERVILGEAVSLALSMLACRRAGVEGPTLVRDESGAALDPSNARAYVAMLRRAAEIVGARHVLFVAHSADVVDLADARIEVGQ